MDLEVQLVQLNHCDEVLFNFWITLLGQQISQHIATSMSRSEWLSPQFQLNELLVFTIASKVRFKKGVSLERYKKQYYSEINFRLNFWKKKKKMKKNYFCLVASAALKLD